MSGHNWLDNEADRPASPGQYGALKKIDPGNPHMRPFDLPAVEALQV